MPMGIFAQIKNAVSLRAIMQPIAPSKLNPYALFVISTNQEFAFNLGVVLDALTMAVNPVMPFVQETMKVVPSVSYGFC